MPAPDVTLIVVPRERFEIARRSLKDIYERTTYPFSLVYVDAGSPTSTRRDLEAQARQRKFRLIRVNEYLTPNQARNIGAAEVSTRYMVFVDNDVLVTPGWLGALVRCAEETGAALVGPLYCHGELERGTVHMTGGQARIFDENGTRRFLENHRFFGQPLATIRPRLRREPCEMVEFHCMLVRTEVFQRVGGLDEGLKSALENPDFCMSVRQTGAEVYFEPASMITYLPPPPLAWSDVPYFMLRWSDAWNRATLEHFRAKWALPDNDPNLTYQFASWTWWRRQALLPHTGVLARVLQWRRGGRLEHMVNEAEVRLNRWLIGDRQHADARALVAVD
jgi:GT2 family glycosyltransferase